MQSQPKCNQRTFYCNKRNDSDILLYDIRLKWSSLKESHRQCMWNGEQVEKKKKRRKSEQSACTVLDILSVCSQCLNRQLKSQFALQMISKPIFNYAYLHVICIFVRNFTFSCTAHHAPTHPFLDDAVFLSLVRSLALTAVCPSRVFSLQQYITFYLTFHMFVAWLLLLWRLLLPLLPP